MKKERKSILFKKEPILKYRNLLAEQKILNNIFTILPHL
jgi:hypothetical protein